ncbi:hypothetical protein GF324_02195 [bacterium]|nr:hypothetical protein [bacterium]
MMTGFRHGLLALCMGVAVVLIGCGTIVHGTRQTLIVETEPDSVTVKVRGITTGHSPLVLNLDRQTDVNLTLERNGYETVTIPLKATVSPWVGGNVFNGLILGFFVDFSSGGAFELKPELPRTKEGRYSPAAFRLKKERILVELQKAIRMPSDQLRTSDKVHSDESPIEE